MLRYYATLLRYVITVINGWYITLLCYYYYIIYYYKANHDVIYLQLLHCYVDTLLQCYTVTLLRWYVVTLLYCYIVTLLHCNVALCYIIVIQIMMFFLTITK